MISTLNMSAHLTFESQPAGWVGDKYYWRKVRRDLIMVVDRMRKDVAAAE